jgi:hypothetical protein
MFNPHSSWDELNIPTTPTPQKDDQQGVKDALLFCSYFSSPQGQRILEHLRARTVDKPCLTVMFDDGVNTQTAMVLREGENNLYRYILSMIAQGHALNSDEVID